MCVEIRRITLQFDYQPYKSDPGRAPGVEVRLSTPQASETVRPAILDTGSEFSCLSATLVPVLFPQGVPNELWGEPKELLGPLGEVVVANAVRLCAEVGGIRFPLEVALLESPPVSMILGRRDFFRSFDVRMNEREAKTFLSKESCADWLPTSSCPCCQHTADFTSCEAAHGLPGCLVLEEIERASVRRRGQ